MVATNRTLQSASLEVSKATAASSTNSKFWMFFDDAVYTRFNSNARVSAH